jgi:arginase
VSEEASAPEFRLIVVPYELGRLRDGVGRGPERLLEAGAEQALATSNAQVRCEVVEIDQSFGHSGMGDVDASFALIREVAKRIRAAVAERVFPVVLSGSCFVAVGVVAGLCEPAPAAVWLDAHSDFNSPDTSLEGYFDGMGLAVLTGGAWQGLLGTVPDALPLPEHRVVLAGARDFDPPEEERLAASQLIRLRSEHLHTPEVLTSAVDAIEPEVTGLYLHVDLDVLDLEVARVNVFGAPGGLDGFELQSLVEAVCRDCPVRAISLTAYDPAYDAEKRVPPIALGLLRTINETCRAGD